MTLGRQNTGMEFHERLQAVLKAKGKSRADVARAAGVANSTAGSWVDGLSKPKIDEACRIAEMLGVSISELCEGESRETGEGLAEDERYVLRLVRSLEFDADEAARVLARSFAFRGWKPGDVVTDELLVPEQPAGPREAKQGRRKV